MIFSEDAILLSLLERYEDEQDVKDAVMSYCQRGAVSQSASKRQEEQRQKPVVEQSTPSDIDNISSPSDSAIDFMKRKRLNQMAAKQAAHVAEKEGPQSVSLGISDCDLGASPAMGKASFLPKQAAQQNQAKLLSPLQLASIFVLNKGNQ